ncbi:PDPK1 [Symbiodinium sp. CCMP2456]|nr:PDPK1 [Symbiodinium sp. CCMP2456]
MTAGIGIEDFVLEESQASQASKEGGGHRAELHREDFEFTTLLGEGAFARVLRARSRQDGREYAIKIVEKKFIQVQNRGNRVITERLMLAKMDHPKIVRLYFAFQDLWCLYFGLELVLGGDLATQIERMGSCSWEFTRFYTAEIIDILSYLRQCRVAHRDLKPENLLLTSEGHLKLVDFDAAMQVPDEGEGDAAGGRASGGEFPPAESFVGTALYVAPEVLLGTAEPQQAFGLDVWALGCIVYLMTVGRTPFHAESEYLVFQRVQTLDYTCPPRVWKKARQFIEGLLQLAPQQRLGVGEEGVADLQQHEFFSPVPHSE